MEESKTHAQQYWLNLVAGQGIRRANKLTQDWEVKYVFDGWSEESILEAYDELMLLLSASLVSLVLFEKAMLRHGIRFR